MHVAGLYNHWLSQLQLYIIQTNIHKVTCLHTSPLPRYFIEKSFHDISVYLVLPAITPNMSTVLAIAANMA